MDTLPELERQLRTALENDDAAAVKQLAGRFREHDLPELAEILSTRTPEQIREYANLFTLL